MPLWSATRPASPLAVMEGRLSATALEAELKDNMRAVSVRRLVVEERERAS